MLKMLISVVGISLWIPWHVSEEWWLESLFSLVEIFLLHILLDFREVIPFLILIKT